MRTLTINYGAGVDLDPNRKAIEILNEYGQTTDVLTLGEAFEQLLSMFMKEGIGMPKGYPMQTPEKWRHDQEMRFAAKDIPF